MNAISGASKNYLIYQRDANQYEEFTQSDFEEMTAEIVGMNRRIEHADVKLKSDHNLEENSIVTRHSTQINDEVSSEMEKMFAIMHEVVVEDDRQKGVKNYDSGLELLGAVGVTLHNSDVAEEEQIIDCLGNNKTSEQIQHANLKLCSEESESNLAAIDVANDAEAMLDTTTQHAGGTQNPNVISFEARPQYECDSCGKRFIKFRNYNNHLKTHNRASLQKCPKCDMFYLRAAALVRHIEQLHTTPEQVDNHRCRYCQKFFRSKYALNIHMRFHTGEFPCECPTCGKRFSDNGHLSQHIRIKHQQFRFKCVHESCGKIFETDRALRNHVYEHDKSWPFVCGHCGKGMGTKYNCRTHISKRHKIYATDDELNAMQQFKRKKISQSHCFQKVPDAQLKYDNDK